MNIFSKLQQAKIIPVLTIENPRNTLPIVNALLKGGLTVVEITLRTKSSLQAAKLARKEIPELTLGLGTVTNEIQLQNALKLNADFIISPGLTDKLANAARSSKAAFIPGVSTVSETLTALEYGFTYQKLFPANLCGGIEMIKQSQRIFPEVKFCPTGGINPNNMLEYLCLRNVFCIGGSWLVPQELIQRKDWDAITKLAVTAKNKLKHMV